MLYKFDSQKKLAQAVAKFQAKYPSGAIYKFDEENWESEREKFEELLLAGNDIFGSKNLVILRDVAELDEQEEEKIKQSETVVLWYQPGVSKAAEPDYFALSNALARRDRRALWLHFQRLLHAGAEPETIFWRAIWWQVRKLGDPPLAARFVSLWHETKREEGRDFGLELEQLLLSI